MELQDFGLHLEVLLGGEDEVLQVRGVGVLRRVEVPHDRLDEERPEERVRQERARQPGNRMPRLVRGHNAKALIARWLMRFINK